MQKKTQHLKFIVIIINKVGHTVDLKNYKVLKNSKQHADLLSKFWDKETDSKAEYCTRNEKTRVIHTTILV